MADEFGLDMEEITRVIDNAEVLIVRFAIVDKRLLIDTRSSEKELPLIVVVPKAGSVQERFTALKKLRPRFPLPDKIMSFMWPRHVDTFLTSGICEHIESRLVGIGGDAMAAACRKAFADLAQEERSEVFSAIRGGEGYQTLWQRRN